MYTHQTNVIIGFFDQKLQTFLEATQYIMASLGINWVLGDGAKITPDKPPQTKPSKRDTPDVSGNQSEASHLPTEALGETPAASNMGCSEGIFALGANANFTKN